MSTPMKTRDEILEALRNHVETDYHPSGTCRMGGDAESVVDGQMRVRGVEKLRVVDASIMPQIVSANLNATVIMLGERAADFILGSDPLPPERPAFAFDAA